MNTKKILLVLAVLLCIAIGVYFIFGDSTDQDITILCPPDAAELIQELVDGYQNENTPHFVVEKVDVAAYDDTIVERLTERHPADLVIFTPDTEPPSDKALACMSDLSNLPGVSDTLLHVREGEKLPVLPLCGDVPVVFYNRDLFAIDSLAPPETTRDLALLCMHFQNRGRCAFGIVLEQDQKTPDLSSLIDCYLLNTHSPSADSLLMYIRSLENTGVFTQEYASDRNQLFASFRDGKSAMINGLWSDFSQVERMDLPFEYGTFLLPGDIPATCGVLIPAISVSVSAGAEEDAMSFVSYLLSETSQELIRSRNNNMSVRNKTSSGGEIEQNLYNTFSSHGLKPSVLSAFAEDNRSILLQGICRAASKEDVDPTQIQSVLSMNKSLKGDTP